MRPKIQPDPWAPGKPLDAYGNELAPGDFVAVDLELLKQGTGLEPRFIVQRIEGPRNSTDPGFVVLSALVGIPYKTRDPIPLVKKLHSPAPLNLTGSDGRPGGLHRGRETEGPTPPRDGEAATETPAPEHERPQEAETATDIKAS